MQQDENIEPVTLPGGEMRKLAVGLTVVAFVASLSPQAHAAGKTYVHDCVRTKYRPRAYVPACDGAYFVKNLHWKFWHLRRALGRGVYHINDCNPSCAEGTHHIRTGKLKFRYRKWCDSLHKYLFRRAIAIYDRPYHGKRWSVFRAYFCP
jgi:hypothetical protein